MKSPFNVTKWQSIISKSTALNPEGNKKAIKNIVYKRIT